MAILEPEPATRFTASEGTGALAAGASLEATPKHLAKAGSLVGKLSPGAEIYLPNLPGTRALDNLDAAKALIADGFRPVPHIAARRLSSRDELSRTADAFAAAGIDSALLIAGDADAPAGPFANTLDVLDSGILAGSGMRRLGVAGHPDGHPIADAGALDEALRIKRDYAAATGTEMWIVTQFLFDSDPIAPWLDHLGALEIGLPVRLGIPGPTKITTLLKYAVECGVGASARFLMRNPGAALALGRWKPDGLMTEIAEIQGQHPFGTIAGLHLYPFGGLERAADWLTKARREPA